MIRDKMRSEDVSWAFGVFVKLIIALFALVMVVVETYFLAH